jgi:4-hydroxy-tetrahydrodipicolinate synthase
LRIIAYTVQHVAGRLPVIAGTGSNDTQHAIALSKAARSLGADALLQVTPYYNKTNQTGLVRHFNAIADAAQLPLILYNIPGRTGMCIQPETYRELARHPQIVATKEAGGDIAAILKTVALCGDDLAIYAGNDNMVTPLLALGGLGVISVLANIAPRAVHALCKLHFDGAYKQSLSLQTQLLPLIDALFCDVNPIPIKEALCTLGCDVGSCRLPLSGLDNTLRVRLHTALLQASRLGLLQTAGEHPRTA